LRHGWQYLPAVTQPAAAAAAPAGRSLSCQLQPLLLLRLLQLLLATALLLPLLSGRQQQQQHLQYLEVQLVLLQ
jgi:hypothetical protein